MVDIPNNILAELRCSECGEHLSYGPITIEINGDNICGRCNKGKPTLLRNTIFEKFASIAAFPCRYKHSGCPLTVPWEHVIEQEDYCDYRPIECPVAPAGSCKWKGPQCNLLPHYEEEHPGLIFQPPCVLNKDITNNNDKNVLLTILSFVFLVQIRFDETVSKMWHCVQCLSNPKISQQFKFKVVFSNDERNLPKVGNVISEKYLTINLENSVETNIKNLLDILGEKFNCTLSILPELNMELKNLFICVKCKDETKNAMYKFDNKYYCISCSPKNSMHDQYYDYLHKLTLKSCENNYYRCCYVNTNKKLIHKHQLWECKRQTKCYFGCEIEIDESENHYRNKNCTISPVFSGNNSYYKNVWYYRIIETDKDDNIFIIKFMVTDSVLQAYVYSNLNEDDIVKYDFEITAKGRIILEHNLIEEHDWEINQQLQRNIVDGRGRYRFNDINIIKKTPSLIIEIDN